MLVKWWNPASELSVLMSSSVATGDYLENKAF